MQKLKSLNKIQIIAIILILVGIAIIVPTVKGMLSNGREFNYAIKNNFAAGNPSTSLIKPWMSLRYIASAYGVPQSYLYDKLSVKPNPDTSMLGLDRLSRQMNLTPVNGKPAILATVIPAIDIYRKNTVTTGLVERHVEGWMTLQYIGNSTGIPPVTFINELNLPSDPTLQFKPLDKLSRDLKYAGGQKAFLKAVQDVVQRLTPEKQLVPPGAPPSGQGPAKPEQTP